MPIPPFTIDGILPPFQGPDPGGDPALMSPYVVTAVEVVDRFGATEARQAILKGWLEHRTALRAAGIVSGFQWLDGSFFEDKEPNDLDLITFLHRPPPLLAIQDWQPFLVGHPELFDRATMKQKFNLDAFFIDMNGSREVLVSYSRYLLQLFSHQRETFLWKGMLQVRLEDVGGDAAALARLVPIPPAKPTGGEP
jgi:hypothetical protein